MSDPEDDSGGFLRGWSRRKLAAKQPEVAPLLPQDPELENAAQEALPDEAEIAELIASLPSLDDITAGFDIKPFLVKGVPASIKNAAMRKLWLASPSVRDYVDPAMDYAWDWNAPGGVPGGGGILSEQSVAKMVKDLIGGKKPEAEPALDEPAPDEELPEPAEEEAVPALVEQVADLSPDPVRLSVTPTSPEPKAERREAPQATPRRHGGAAPE
ncbi:DUF3306 domain-containing protein [Sulfitobacter guttiformis]|uniref:Uncharacterized protein DUF3306 n=1 Tax=Sulfitobacter guttiformis TaxID=74349 RepID=A0A420DJ30_9RHOB|nr:DUF3306 domain-containing protein [Sulfitobacter guttiformis]KIN71949.1 DUF3306 domain containing protein [Sulfitobacter guttiformis KCTC 32187]RKE94250.1 uncharacterized protein DUF3306 [Sulfitobacter guttiformis]